MGTEIRRRRRFLDAQGQGAQHGQIGSRANRPTGIGSEGWDTDYNAGHQPQQKSQAHSTHSDRAWRLCSEVHVLYNGPYEWIGLVRYPVQSVSLDRTVVFLCVLHGLMKVTPYE